MDNHKTIELDVTQVETDHWDQLSFHRRINQLAYSETANELFENSLQLLIQFTEADSATYFRRDQESGELIVEAVCGDDESQYLVGLRLPNREALMHIMHNEDQPIIIGDLPGDPRWLRVVNPTTAARMVNLISLPLVANKKLWGVIQIYNYKCANLDLDRLGFLGDRVALEFERHAMIDATNSRNERLMNLLDAIGETSGFMNRKQILQAVLRKATELVGAERTSIFLNEPASGGIRFQIAYQAGERHPYGFVQAPSKIEVRQKREARNSISPAHLISHSAITVPIQLQGTNPDIDDDFRSLGGLMALNPNRGCFTEDDVQILNILAQQTSNFLQVAEVFESTEELFLDAIKALVTAIDAKDPYTQGHSHRVSEYSVLIAQELGLNDLQINNVRIGSLLHDVGKIGIPDAILKKDGQLTTEEWISIKEHPATGWNILRQVRLLEPNLPAIIEHHEKLDGSGYPHGLIGEEISLMGRIVAVVDVFDAMTSDRPYRPAMKVSEVLDYLEQKAGTLFDERCVNALKKVVDRSNDLD